MPHSALSSDVTRLASWQALTAHRDQLNGFSLRQAFAEDPQRFATFSLNDCGLFLDYSKNLINAQTRDLLVGLAKEVDLQGAIKALFEGEIVNSSEGRPALHTALRRPVGDKLSVNGVNVMPEVHKVLNQITDLVKEAMGYNKDRGDSLNVVNSPFAEPPREVIPEQPVAQLVTGLGATGQALCEAVKAKGIRIWVVAFASGLTSELSTCASTNSAFTASNASQLDEAFQSIAKQVGELRVVQ